MRTYALFLFIISATTANAQWDLGLQGGLNRKLPVESNGPTYRGVPEVQKVDVTPSFIGGIQILSDKERVVNFGAGIMVKHNVLRNYHEWPTEWQVRDIKHRSLYLSLHPILDVNIDKKRHFHLLVHPNFQYLLYGRDSGVITSATGPVSVYDNVSKTVKKFVMGISTQVQFRYPVTKYVQAVAALGYSINNTTSRFIPAEHGNLSIQIGATMKLRNKVPGKEAEKKKEEKVKAE